MKFKVYEDVAGQYRWKLIAGNGEVIAQGEGYTRRRDAKRAVRALRLTVWMAPVVDD